MSNVDRALAVVEEAKAMKVVSPETYKLAVGYGQGLKALRKEVSETFDPIISKAHAAHKEAVAQKKKYTDPIDEADAIVNRAATAYKIEEDRKAEEAEALLRAKELKAVEEARLAEAVALEAAGDVETAERHLELPITAPPVEVVSAAPKVDGAGLRKNWTFEITDPAAVPREFLMPDEMKIRKYVKAMEGETKIPGVRVWNAAKLAYGAAKEAK